MAQYKMLDGNLAAVEAIKMARVKVIAAYPITPQSSISEKLSALVDSGELDAKCIRVESEHSAISCCVGAQLTGVRTATATSSVGLALMHEVLGVASGCRLPIVMPIVNRSLASPWSLWCDHQDTMAERDSGWIQIYCENVQDVYDSVIMAYRIAEHEDVLTPAMVCLDGFFLSHSMQKISVPDQSEIDEFVGEYVPRNYYFDTSDPLMLDNLTGSDEVTEMKRQQAIGFSNAKCVVDEVYEEFGKKFGRTKYPAEGYRLEGAEAVIITLGSMSGTAKHVVDKLRSEGLSVGAVKISCFRPFPFERLAQLLGGVKKVAVLDRAIGTGAQGSPVWLEVRTALGHETFVKSYIGGLGGRDVNITTIEKVFSDILADDGAGPREPVWIDCKENFMDVRQVVFNV